LDQYLVLQNVVWAEHSFHIALAKIDPLPNTLKEHIQLCSFVLEAKSSITIDYFIHFQLSLLALLLLAYAGLLINFHNIKGIKVVGVREILKSLLKLLTTSIPCTLNHCRLKFFAEALKVPWVVVE
jgi:hypothetical protein